jgi:nucleotide-binding universal stress UspA family protein
VAAPSGVATPTAASVGTEARPVLLVTLGAPFDETACSVAVDAAVECGQPLAIANVVELPPLPMSVRLGYDQIETPELEDALRSVAALAASCGVRVERLRVKSPRPVAALLELVDELEPSLVVLGSDPTRVSRRRYRRAAAALRTVSRSLVWIP